MPSSVVAVGGSLQSGSSWLRKRSSSRFFAPMMNERRLAVTASCLARKRRGAVPVPRPTSRTLPFVSVKLFPNGPRTPTMSPFFI